MKVLVVGFSITAEMPGYVEKAASLILPEEALTLSKVGLGGLHPINIKYLFPSILRDHAPDVVILDHSTSSFRQFPLSREEYKSGLKSILRTCWEAKVQVGIFDLPRADVDYTDDWVVKYHEELSDKLSISHCLAPIGEGLLRDVVHPTALGHQLYAEALLQLVKRVGPIEADADFFLGVPQYDAITVCSLASDHYAREDFNRGGYSLPLVNIRAGDTLSLALDAPARIYGVTSLMGPKTGYLKLDVEGRGRNVLSYDEHSYYNRLSVFSVAGGGAATFTSAQICITQTPEQPKVALLKGVADTSARVGAIGHILIERDLTA